MPTTEHEAIGDLFRSDPHLAPRLLKALFGKAIPHYTRIRVGDATLNQTMSVEFRADVVLILEDERQIPVLSIIVEVQREVDERKEETWPVYPTVQRAKTNCPAIVLVVATNEAVAEWAAAPIDVGWGLTIMQPLVLGPKLIPLITDVEVARKEPLLGFLSALCHDEGDRGVEAVLATERALVQLPEALSREVALTMFAVVYNHVSAPLKRAIEAMLMELKLNNRMVEIPPFLQEYVEQGLSQGELRQARRVVLRWAERAALVLTDEQRRLIETCEDLPTLERWEENAAHAKTADDVFRSGQTPRRDRSKR